MLSSPEVKEWSTRDRWYDQNNDVVRIEGWATELHGFCHIGGFAGCPASQTNLQWCLHDFRQTVYELLASTVEFAKVSENIRSRRFGVRRHRTQYCALGFIYVHNSRGGENVAMPCLIVVVHPRKEFDASIQGDQESIGFVMERSARAHVTTGDDTGECQ